MNIIEAEACPDHIHMLVEIPPNICVAQFMEYLKGKSSLMIFDRHANLKYKYRNRHFLCRGYYVDIIIKLTDVRTYKSVAEEADISTTTAQRIFDNVNYPHISEMPEVLAIDEFKGNASGEKFQCILTDPKNKIVLDILPTRFENDLNSYFRKYENEQRQNVHFFVSDMWKPYFRMADNWFSNATKIVDKYHWIRQVIWAFERVRKRAQQSLDDSMRKYFKRSRSLLIKPFNSLNDTDKQAVNIMLSYSADIRDAHCLK